MIVMRRNIPPTANASQARAIIQRTLNNHLKTADLSSDFDVIIVDEGPIKGQYTLDTVNPDATKDSELFDNLLNQFDRSDTVPTSPFSNEKLVLTAGGVSVAILWIFYGLYHLIKTLCHEQKAPRILLLGLTKGVSFCVIGWLTPPVIDWCWNTAMIHLNGPIF